MNVGVLIITHENIGADLLSTAENILQKKTLNIRTIGIKPQCVPENESAHIADVIKKLDHGDGVLILTDIFGATPCNLVRQASAHASIRLVAGLNLAMLIRIMNYPQLSLSQLAEKAISAGHDSVFECQTQIH